MTSELSISGTLEFLFLIQLKARIFIFFNWFLINVFNNFNKINLDPMRVVQEERSF